VTKQFTLGKNERLKSRKLIDQLFKEGNRLQVGNIRALYLVKPVINNTDKFIPVLQAGVTASSRNFKRAVDRNRVKRLLKECWRLQKNELQSLLTTKKCQLIIFLVYTGKELPGFEVLSGQVKLILEKLEQQRWNEKTTLHT